MFMSSANFMSSAQVPRDIGAIEVTYYYYYYMVLINLSNNLQITNVKLTGMFS